MTNFISVVKAEAYKQFRMRLHSIWVVFSMLLWPLLAFTTAYFQFKPFDFTAVQAEISYLTDEVLMTFIMIGYFAMVFFRSFVQSAWEFTDERIYGTLELIYLSPANRMAVMLGNAAASLIINVWMFGVFMLAIFGLFNNVPIPNPWLLGCGFLLMVVMSILWGTFLNALFLITRDSSMLFTVLEEPMELFGGVKIPVAIFPTWAKAIGGIFPLTYSIRLLRQLIFEQPTFYEVSGLIYTCSLICITLLILTHIVLKLGEVHNTRTGDMTLF